VNPSIHFSSATDRWSTPRDLYTALDAEFRFTFDPCPLDGDIDGTNPLLSQWGGQRVFCNPPYGPKIRGFLERAHEANLAVYLLPARTSSEIPETAA
jgi:DNA N-6-adenine-methyltransferase (Dam)